MIKLHELPTGPDSVVYRGDRMAGGCIVRVVTGDSSKVLDPRNDLRNHSPTGLEWGYGGAGPCQLSLALLADAVGDALAVCHYFRFKKEVVSQVNDDTWQIRRDTIAMLVDHWDRQDFPGRYRSAAA